MLVSQPGPHLVPPCQNCTNHKIQECNSKCSNAPLALSSDPENFPLEPKVVPLVYELRKMRVVQPCWSCEGHIGHDGKLWKFPQVCFYSGSPVYAMLLANHLTQLKHEKKITNDWSINVTAFGHQHGGITYTIEPKLYPDVDIHLGSMQVDLLVISEDLADKMNREALNLLSLLR